MKHKFAWDTRRIEQKHGRTIHVTLYEALGLERRVWLTVSFIFFQKFSTWQSNCSANAASFKNNGYNYSNVKRNYTQRRTSQASYRTT